MTRIMRHEIRTLLTPAKTAAEWLSEPLDWSRQIGPSHESIVFDAAVELALRDDGFRKRLGDKMRDLGEGKARRTIPLRAGEVQMVAMTAEMIRAHKPGAPSKIPRLFDEIAAVMGMTASRVKALYYKSRK